MEPRTAVPNLTDRAYATIKSQLIYLDLPPGTMFTEASLARELGSEQDLDAVATTVASRFGEVFERQPLEVAAGDLAAFDPAAAAVR